MTDYTRVQKELVSLGWNGEPGRGDHVKFRHPDKKTTITVSRSLSTSGYGYGNKIAEIRKVEPRFSLGRPSGWMPPAEISSLPSYAEEAAPVENSAIVPSIEDKTFYRNASWIKTGVLIQTKTKPRMTGRVITVHSADQTHVFNETDILSVRTADKKMFDVMAGDVNALLEQRCDCCGKLVPVNLFPIGKNGTMKTTCQKCIDEKKKTPKKQIIEAEQDMNKTEQKTAAGIPENLSSVLDRIRQEYAKSGYTGRQLEILTALCEYHKEYGRIITEEFLSCAQNAETFSLEEANFRGIMAASIKCLNLFGDMKAMSLDNLTDQELYNALKGRGYDGRMTKTVTLE